MCKRLKFDYVDRLYTHKPESAKENEMDKILWDFDKQIDHPILTRNPNLLLNNKKTCQPVYFAVSGDQRVKIKESKKIGKYFELARELKKPYKVMVIPILVCGLEWTEDQRKNWDYPDYTSAKIS